MHIKPTKNEKTFKDNEILVTKTDLKGNIIYGNRNFLRIIEANEDEIIGKAHNIIRHPDMPKAVFKLLWDVIEAGGEIFAFVINKTKSGTAYWVYANITPSFDENGKIIAYYSVRRRPNPKALEIIKPIYAQMLQAEKTGGVSASTKILLDLLNQKGMEYNELIIAIQE